MISYSYRKVKGGLREMLLGLEKSCSDSKLNVNVKKNKCMIFNKSGRIIHRFFHYKGIPLENVCSYKYLDFLVTPSESITKGLEDLRDKALKALMKIRHGMGKLFNKSIRDTLVSLTIWSNLYCYMQVTSGVVINFQ